MEFQLTLKDVPASRERMVVPPDEPSIWTTKSHGSLQARQVILVTDSLLMRPWNAYSFISQQHILEKAEHARVLPLSHPYDSS